MRKRKVSKILEDANARLAGIKSIADNLDLGNGMTVEIYAQKITATTNSLADYNTALSTADDKQTVHEVNEKDLKDFHERMLLAVGAKYGKNSSEYEMAGGTKKNERRRSTPANNENSNP